MPPPTEKRPHRQPDGTWRYDTEPSKLRRKTGWDYRRPGSYAITLVLADRRGNWLGELVTAPEQARPHSQSPHGCVPVSVIPASSSAGELARPYISLSPLGAAVARLWQSLAELWPGVEPREVQVMPEHFHGILRVATPQRHPLGQIIGSFKAKATAIARELAAGGAPVPPGILAGEGLFAPGFNDTILWNLRRYRQECDYILTNPNRLAAKRAHPDLFRVVRDLAVALPGYGNAIGHFQAIGNHFLLRRPLFQVQVSRRFFGYCRATPPRGAHPEIVRNSAGNPVVAFESSDYTTRRDAAFAAAAEGRVLLSPCVSDGERQIAREALSAGLPPITLANKGFAPLQKPSGHHFDACAAGRLLMLSPVAWPYQPGHKPMTRFDATAMNRVCQWLAGEDAAAISYHGMTPSNVDQLAADAILCDCPANAAVR